MNNQRLKLFPVLFFTLLVAMILAPHPAPAAPEPLEAKQVSVPPLDARPFGLNTHLATRYTDLDTMHVPADLIADAGVGWVREDIHWWRVQPDPDTWDWSYTDKAFRELLRRDIRILGVIGHPPGWATPYRHDDPSQNSFYAPDARRFALFARAVVQRYGTYVDHWEIWNEPDNDLFWKPAPDAEAYATMLRYTAHAIRSVDPDATILIGGLNPFDTDFLRTIAETGAWESFDILALHPYVNPYEPEAGNIGASLDGMRTLAERYGEKPIWITEIGWSSGPGDRDAIGLANADDQANYLVRSSLLLWQAGAERIFWYTLKDDEDNPYGLFEYRRGRDDFSRPKPAYTALKTLNEQLAGAEFVNMRDLFDRTMVFDFEQFGTWRRGDEPNGTFNRSSAVQRSGRYAAELTYTFPTSGNDYVVFLRDRAIPIPGEPYALGMWVYGDGSGNTLRVWLRDAEGEILQYTLGTVGPEGWHFLQAPLGEQVPAWDRINRVGNGRLDFPASLHAVVLDDTPDTFRGEGVIYLDDLVAISGPEAYNMQLQRGDQALDVLWAPVGLNARLSSSATSATLVARDGDQSTASVRDRRISLSLGPAPRYLLHER